METKISMCFRLRNDKQTKEKLFPIYLRITINGKRFECSTQRCIEKSQWSQKQERAKNTFAEAKTINEYLDILKHKAFVYQKELTLEEKLITVHSFKSKWLGIKESQRTILEVFRHHNEKMKQLIGKDFAEGTYERYQTSFEHTQRYIEWKYRVKDLDITALNYEFLTEYEYWLKTVRNCGHNSTMKYLANFKKIVLICVKNGWLLKDPFFGYKFSKKEVERLFLSDVELTAVREKAFPTERMRRVRDIFVFACYTGLAYADVQKLKRSEIHVGIDGKKWIFTFRRKTNTPSRIPLLPISIAILERYANDPDCIAKDLLLPVPTNQKLNSYLKELADVCGITKELTFHIARHTFATTVTLNNGVPIETVSKMLGHTNLKTTQHYAKLLDTRVSVDMERLHDKLEAKRQLSALKAI